MAGGIGPENRRDVQPPNYITNVQQYMMNEQLIRQIIDTIEKSVKENGRALSKVEARVLNLGKGIIENYSKVAEELKASGSSNPNKNQAQLIKTSMDDLFKDLRLLIKSNPSGLGKNERADESWREVARLGQDLADNITGNLERITSVMENIIDFQKEAQKITEKSSSNNTSTISDMERIGKAREKGIISDEFARRLGHAVSNAKAPSSEQNIQTYFSTLEDIHRQDNFRKAKLDSERDARRLYHKNHPFGGAVSGTAKKAVGVLSTRSDFFNQLHKTIGMIPGIGKITGGLAGASKAATAGAGIAGAAGAALGAIAVGVSLIYKQMKKSSPVLQAVSNLFELAWNLLWMPLGNALGTMLLPMAEDLIEFAILFNELFTDFSWEKLGEIFYAALQFIWGALYDISNALPTLIFDGLMDVLINFFRNIGWDGVADAFEKVKELRAILGDFIRNWPTKLWNALYNIWTYIKNFFTDMFNSVGDIISDAIDDALSGIKDVGGKAADWFDSINPFATGGIVTGPTLGLVGEAGPEAIIPLDKANGVGTTYVININGDVYGVSDLEDRIERAIQRTANKAYYR